MLQAKSKTVELLPAASFKTTGRFKSLFYKNRYIIFSFFISVLIVCITYAVRKIYPFGDRCVLKVDLYHQYAPYLEELRSRLLSGQSLLYSWEGGLGKDFLSQMAYYTASPLCFLILLFPEEHLPEALALLILLKTGLCAAAFSFYLKARFRKNDLSVLIFGILYAFCAFMTCYYWNVMWLDTVYLFPFVALGVESLVQKNRQLLYYISLVLTMVINFYLAVLVCILTAFYFIVVLFSNYSLRTDRRLIFRRTVKFGLISVLCAMTAMFVLAPVAIALGQTATEHTAFPSFSVYKNVWQLFTNHFLGARAVVLGKNEDLPNIYSGVLTMMLLPAYFFNPGIKQKEKWLNAAFLAVMLLCASIKPLDFLIHGMHFPANLPHRYTFIYSFLLLTMAYKGFLKLDQFRFRRAAAFAAGYAVLILASEFIMIRLIPDLERVLSDTDILLNLGLMAVYLFLLYLVRNKAAGLFLPLLFLCVSGEAVFSFIQNLDTTGDREAYVAYMSDTENAVDYLDENDSGQFYRTEFRRFTTLNDASLYHYNGFTQFSSLAPGGVSALIRNMGIAATGNSYRYYDPTDLVDAVFNIKYVLDKDNTLNNNSRYQFIKRCGSVYIYQNRYLLPLGFLVNSKITDWKTDGSQPFAVQNDFLKKAAGADQDMFTMIPVTNITRSNMTYTELSGPGCFNYELTDPGDLSKTPTVTADYTVTKDQYLYLYVDAPNAKRFVYTTSSGRQDRELSAGRSLIDVGQVSAGETVHVEFSLTKHGKFETTYRKSGTVKLYAASYDRTVFETGYLKLADQPYKITSFSDTRVEGTVNATEDCVLYTSIPYIKGWKVSVDGKKTDKLSIGEDGLTGVSIPAGEHTVIFRYSPDVLLPSVLISIAGAGLFVLYCRFEKRHPEQSAPDKPFNRR